MEHIKIYETGAVLDSATASKIAEFERSMREIKKAEDELKKAILAEMESSGLIKVETDELIISYIAPTERETLDSKTLRAELPDIYDEYIKISPVAASIRIKLKG